MSGAGVGAAWSRPFLSGAGAGADTIGSEPELGFWSRCRSRPKKWRLLNTGCSIFYITSVPNCSSFHSLSLPFKKYRLHVILYLTCCLLGGGLCTSPFLSLCRPSVWSYLFSSNLTKEGPAMTTVLNNRSSSKIG